MMPAAAIAATGFTLLMPGIVGYVLRKFDFDPAPLVPPCIDATSLSLSTWFNGSAVGTVAAATSGGACGMPSAAGSGS